MRADRIVVGDCVGASGYDFLQAMNTGVMGCIGTITARSVKDCLRRLESMVRLGEPGATPQYSRELIADSVHVIVQLERLTDGSRKVTEIAEIHGLKRGEFVVTPIFKWQPNKESDHPPDWHHVGPLARSRFVSNVREHKTLAELDERDERDESV
jgi:pilus assembly protein CpaF